MPGTNDTFLYATGAANTYLWSTGANWALGVPPTSSENVVVNGGAGSPISFINQDFTIQQLAVTSGGLVEIASGVTLTATTNVTGISGSIGAGALGFQCERNRAV